MNFELVIVVWDNGVFKMRDRIEALDFTDLESKTRHLLEDLEDKIRNENEKKYRIAEDDDIPF